MRTQRVIALPRLDGPRVAGAADADGFLPVDEQGAVSAGVPISATPFRPVLRAELVTGGVSVFLEHAVAGGDSTASDQPSWWPPTKVAAAHLAPYLAEVDGEVLARLS